MKNSKKNTKILLEATDLQKLENIYKNKCIIKSLGVDNSYKPVKHGNGIFISNEPNYLPKTNYTLTYKDDNKEDQTKFLGDALFTMIKGRPNSLFIFFIEKQSYKKIEFNLLTQTIKESPVNCQKNSTERTPALDTDLMSTDQQNEVTHLLSKKNKDNKQIYFSSITIDNKTEVNYRGDDWEKLDLSNLDVPKFDKSLFKKGEYFVYKQKTVETPVSDFNQDVENWLNQRGYTQIKPSSTTSQRIGQSTKLSYINGGVDIAREIRKDLTIYPQSLIYTGESTLLDYKRENYKIIKGACDKIISKMYELLQTPDNEKAEEFKKEPEAIFDMKVQINWCKKNKMDSLKKESKEKLKDLEKWTPNDNVFGMANFQVYQNESSIRLKKMIKESLLETNQNKKRLIKEEKIVSLRFEILKENFINENQKVTQEFVDGLLNEVSYLNGQGFDQRIIKEEFMDFFKGLFGDKWNTIAQTFREKVGEWIIKKLNLPTDSWWASFVITGLGNLRPSEIPNLMTCPGMTKFISKTMVEGSLKKLSSNVGIDNLFVTTLRNRIVEMLEDSSFGEKLEDSLTSAICPALTGLTSKLENSVDAMKTKALS